ncbi:MAG TPA: fatty acid desaturase, partial [Candidatus Eisenbacteria bacterium]|nr:fatty acid desaturase [Candidatus Eisenbacteria bacterium]
MKRRVADYFESRRISPKANASMVVKTILLLVVTFGSYGLILSNQFTPIQMLGLAVLMGIGTAGIGFGIAHDALHGAYSSRPWVNKLLGFSFELAGASGYMWKITHNVIHHTYPNVHGLDEDLEVSPLLRLSPQAKHRWIHRFQH